MKNIKQLLAKASTFKPLSLKIQDETIPYEKRQELLKNLSNEYHNWYRTALILFDLATQPEKMEKFESEYKGWTLDPKISGFLNGGADDSLLHNPDKPVKYARWQHPVNTRFIIPLDKQLNALATLEPYIDQIDKKISITNNRSNLNFLQITDESIDQSKLCDTICTTFNDAELSKLCFDLNIETEYIQWGALIDNVQGVIQYMYRRGKLTELASHVLEERPHTLKTFKTVIVKG